jgi:Fungal Zn(2)-Cys(6) binuclear cluster domain
MATAQKRGHQDQAGVQSGNAPTKRIRTAHACDSCRVRKSRCDGARPICDICAAMGLQCRYRAPARPSLPNIRDEQTARIESRLLAIEALLRTNIRQSQCHISPAHCLATPDDGHSDQRSVQMEALPNTDQAMCSNNTSNGIPSAPGMRANNDGVDGLALIKVRDEEPSVFFGATLNARFETESRVG